MPTDSASQNQGETVRICLAPTLRVRQGESQSGGRPASQRTRFTGRLLFPGAVWGPVARLSGRRSGLGRAGGGG
jgi:hypothetical protein